MLILYIRVTTICSFRVPFWMLTLIYSQVRGCQSKDASFIHSFRTTRYHGHQRRQFANKCIQSVPSLLLCLVPHFPTITETKRNTLSWKKHITREKHYPRYPEDVTVMLRIQNCKETSFFFLLNWSSCKMFEKTFLLRIVQVYSS